MTHNRASTECIHHRTLTHSNSQGFHDEKGKSWMSSRLFIYILANLNPNDNTAILQQITKLDAIYWLLTTTLLDINTVTCISWMPCIIFGIV